MSEVPDGNVPVGEWIDVPSNRVIAPDTYYDDAGVLRSSGDHSCVVWHWGPKHCQRRGIQPDEIVYDKDTGAPWCPECWPVRIDFYERKRLMHLFEQKTKKG